MSVESVTQAVSDLALAFSDQDDEVYAMVINNFRFLNCFLNFFLIISCLFFNRVESSIWRGSLVGGSRWDRSSSVKKKSLLNLFSICQIKYFYASIFKDSIWSQVVPIWSTKPKLSAQALRALNRTCKRFSTRFRFLPILILWLN
jgi:hypothetical protein